MSSLDDTGDSAEELPPSEASGGSKRRRLTPVERIADIVEMEHEADVAERSSGYTSVMTASTAVQSALATLKLLKESNVDEDIIATAEEKVNGLVHRWMSEMDPKENS